MLFDFLKTSRQTFGFRPFQEDTHGLPIPRWVWTFGEPFVSERSLMFGRVQRVFDLMCCFVLSHSLSALFETVTESECTETLCMNSVSGLLEVSCG